MAGSLTQAQLSEKSVNINSFTGAQNTSYVSVEDALMKDQAFRDEKTAPRLFFHTTYTYANHPWILVSPDKSAQETVVDSMHTLDLGVAYYLRKNLSASFQIPVNYVSVSPEYGGTKDTHVGDSRMSLKWKFAGDEDTGFAVIPEFHLPTGVRYEGLNEGAGLGNSSLGFGARFAFEQAFESLSLSANLGYLSFSNAEAKNETTGGYPQIDGRSRIIAGIATLISISEKWALNFEYTSLLTAGGENDFTPPGEIYGGFRYQASKDVSIHGGGGTGRLQGVGGNDPRVVLGVKFPLFFQREVARKDGPVADVEPAYDTYEKTTTTTTTTTTTELPPLPEPAQEIAPVPIVNLDNSAPSMDIEKKVVYTKQEIYILDEVEFDLNKSTLTPKGRLILDQVARVIGIHINDIPRLHIAGHTDHQGNDRINDPLSNSRAKSVRRYLIQRGVDDRILSDKGYGSHKPKYNFRKVPKRLWEKNRRVEFKILKK